MSVLRWWVCAVMLGCEAPDSRLDGCIEAEGRVEIYDDGELIGRSHTMDGVHPNCLTVERFEREWSMFRESPTPFFELEERFLDHSPFRIYVGHPGCIDVVYFYPTAEDAYLIIEGPQILAGAHYAASLFLLEPASRMPAPVTRRIEIQSGTMRIPGKFVAGTGSVLEDYYVQSLRARLREIHDESHEDIHF